MSRAAALLAVLALSACTTPGIRVEPVPVPVAARCVDLATVPPEPPHVDQQLTGDADRDVNTVAASAIVLRAWGRQLLAVVQECGR